MVLAAHLDCRSLLQHCAEKPPCCKAVCSRCSLCSMLTLQLECGDHIASDNQVASPLEVHKTLRNSMLHSHLQPAGLLVCQHTMNCGPQQAHTGRHTNRSSHSNAATHCCKISLAGRPHLQQFRSTQQPAQQWTSAHLASPGLQHPLQGVLLLQGSDHLQNFLLLGHLQPSGNPQPCSFTEQRCFEHAAELSKLSKLHMLS